MRILTYNIRGGRGMDGRRSLARIATTILSEAPDVVCLQEVHRRLPHSAFEDQPLILGELLGMKCLFQDNLRLPRMSYGNALFSGLPMEQVDTLLLPSVRELLVAPALALERRGAIGAWIAGADGERFFVATTHWSLDKNDRYQSAGVLAEWLQPRAGATVVVGDLNAEGTSPEVLRLVQEAGLRDLGAVDALPTYTSLRPLRRIDYVLCSDEMSCGHVRVVDGIGSDHLAVVADMFLKKQ